MLKKFVIERSAPNIGTTSNVDLAQMAAESNKILNEMGPQIQWHESYITNDKIYCVYLAENENLIREHAIRGKFPLDSITEVKSVLDPASEAQYSMPPKAGGMSQGQHA